MIQWVVSSYRGVAFLWLGVVLASLGWVGYGFVTQEVDQHFLSFLPKSSQEGFQEATEYMTRGPHAQKIIFGFGHEDPDVARAALEAFKTQIREKKFPVKEINPESQTQEWMSLFKDLKSQQDDFLSPKDRLLLEKNQGSKILKRAVSEYLGPMAQGDRFDPLDPFSLYRSFIKDLNAPSSTILVGGMDLIKEGSVYWGVYQGRLIGDPFGSEVQDVFEKKLDPWVASLKERFGVTVLQQGSVFYALKGMAEGRSDMTTLGLLSLGGTILLLLISFGTLRPLIFGCVIITSGLAMGLGAAFILFSKIYMVSLVFATALIGISIDYALHFTCAFFEKSSLKEVLSSLYPALPLGMLTSVLGYGLLVFSPVVAVAQMAVIGAFGLAGAFISVWLWGGVFIRPLKEGPLGMGRLVVRILDGVATFGSKSKVSRMVAVLCMGLGVIGVTFMHPQDQVKKFQELDGDLHSQQMKLNALMKVPSEKVVWFVVGTTLETLLENQEALWEIYRESLHDDSALSGREIQGLSSILPSQKRQEHHKKLIQERLMNPYASRLRDLLSWPLTKSLETQEGGVDKGISQVQNYLSLFSKKHSVVQELVFSIPQGFMGPVVMDQQVAEVLLNMKRSHPNWEAFVITPLDHYTDLFQEYRRYLSGLVLGLLVCFGAVLVLWKGARSGVRIVAPLVYGLLATWGVVVLLSPGLSVFSMMGFIMVMCIGIDYALFLGTSGSQKNKGSKRILLANGLCALTTILSFGLLLFAHTPAVQDFGRVVFVGIVMNVTLTSLFLGVPRQPKETS